MDILPTVLKRSCHDQSKNTCKELSQDEACSLDIGTQYWTDLHGTALKNNELNVAMDDIRHWGLVLICILYNAWQRSVFAIFAPVHDDDMSTQLLCARSCAANIFVYTKVRALAKCNLFQPEVYIYLIRILVLVPFMILPLERRLFVLSLFSFVIFSKSTVFIICA